MEGRVDFNALERSRLLGSMTAGSLGPLGPTSYSGGESAHTHSSGLSRLGSGSAAAAVAAGVTPPELTRAGSPTTLQPQYAGRFLPSGSMHSPGASYAMMAGYLANTGHVPDSLKHLMPEFQQYWASASASAAHSEGYARYLLNSMYYPYLPYLPATESLSLFAQNSANAQFQAAALQAQAQHRIYDLQKEALFGSSSGPHSHYPQTYPFPLTSGQLEATNLSLSSSSKTKQADKSRDGDLRENCTPKDSEKNRDKDICSDRKRTSDSEKELQQETRVKNAEGSERTRGTTNSKTDDRDKIKSSAKFTKQTEVQNSTNTGSSHVKITGKLESRGKSLKTSTSSDTKHNFNQEHNISNSKYSQEGAALVPYKTSDRKLTVDNGQANVAVIHNFSPNRPTAFHSPTRQDRVLSPGRRSKAARSPTRTPTRTPTMISPVRTPNVISPVQTICEYNSNSSVQEMPENLCVKDRKRHKEVEPIPDTSDVNDSENGIDAKGVRTQTIATGTTVTVTSTLNVITSDSFCTQGRNDESNSVKGLDSPSSQVSPALSPSATNTTYSLPYYHSLYARSQQPSQQGKRVHAVTYVPEIGTVSSPIAGAPSVIHVIDTHRSVEENNTGDLQNHEADSLRRLTNHSEIHEDENCAWIDNDKVDDDIDAKETVNHLKGSTMESPVNICDSPKRGKEAKKYKGDIENTNIVKSVLSDTTESKDINTRNNRDCVQKQDKSKTDDKNDKSNECSSTQISKKSNKIKSSVFEGNGNEKGVNKKESDSDNYNVNVSGVDKVHDLRCNYKKDKTVTCKVEGKSEKSLNEINKSKCDLNHNSKARCDIKSTDKDKDITHHKSRPKSLTVLDLSDIIPVNEASNIDILKDADDHTVDSQSESLESSGSDTNIGKQTTCIKRVCVQKQTTDAPSSGAFNTDSLRKPSTPDVSLKMAKSGLSKQADCHLPITSIAGASTIPVGIAVARQRNIAPKVQNDKEVKRIVDDGKSKTQGSDIKPVRPLKIIRPSTKGATPTTVEKRNELPANLIVTGGSTTPGGVFWPDDPGSRQQLAAQFLQSPITPTTWYGQSQFPFSHTATTTTSDGSPGHQLPLTVPPGYKLAQDSLTGQILLIPAGADVYDTSRVFSGYPLGTQLQQGSTYGASLLAGQQATTSLSSTPTLFTGQQSVPERSSHLEFAVPHYQQIYNASILSGSEVAYKGDKSVTSSQTSASAVITSSAQLSSGQDRDTGVPLNIHHDQTTDKDAILNATQSAVGADMSIAPGQHCSYNFPSTTLPFVFNSSLLSAHNMVEPAPEVTQLKHEHASVQSRGTSPMLPATDSSNEEEDGTLHPAAKSDVKKDDNVVICDSDNEKESIIEQEEKAVIIKEIKEETIATACNPENKLTLKVINEDGMEHDTGVSKVDDSDISISRKSLFPSHDTSLPDIEETDLQDNKHIQSIKENNVSINPPKVEDTKHESIFPCTFKTDRNIFTDLTEYNPFTDPQILQAVDGLELLSALAEKSSLCTINVNNPDSELKSPQNKKEENNVEDVYTFKEDKSPVCCPVKKGDYNSGSQNSEVKMKCISTNYKLDKINTKDPTGIKIKQETPKSRIKFGHAFKPKKKEEIQVNVEKRTTTFCGITIPEDLDSFLEIEDDIIDSIEMEMKMRLAELQKRYKEKQRELAKLTPKKDKELEKDKESDKPKHCSDKSIDLKRGPGRPKKRHHEAGDGTDGSCESAAIKFKTHKKDHQGNHSNHSGSPPSGSHTVSNGNNGNQHGPTKKKKIAELLVDRVFRKTGGSFKIPLSKKINLIAPARIELPGGSSTVERNEPAPHNKSLDFGKLIKRSRFSQINGKDRSFVGGLWNRKEEKRRKHSLFHSSNIKLKKKKKERDYSSDNGLGLLAEYATKTQEEAQQTKRKSEETPQTKRKSEETSQTKRKPEEISQTKRKAEETPQTKQKAVETPQTKREAEETPQTKRKSEEFKSSPSTESSPTKKRKPGRPKKCDASRPGVTETIVAKQSKHMDFFRWQTDEPKQERKISLEGKTPLKALYLDEWNVRRSERIFLSDPSPQTSPNAVSPNVKANADDTTQKNTEHGVKQETTKKQSEPSKKSRSINLSQKVKKKYSTGFSQQKARDKTTDLLKASRDRLTLKRQEKKLKLMSSSSCQTGSDSDTDDVPLIAFRPRPKTPEPPNCIIGKDELTDGIRILVFMDGLFHEGELKAIRPPDIYGAILDNERRTRPHYFSQEEILKDAIQEVKPTSPKQMKEGTRICAYWSQQFSCLYPGTISRGSPNPNNDNGLFNVEFDDGDTGKIPLDHIRIIPKDFPVVEYDPNPLLLLTKRRRTVSISEGSESRKSHSEVTPTKDANSKRGPGRPPKAERMLSIVSVGDEDVFLADDKTGEKQRKTKGESKEEKGNDETPSKKADQLATPFQIRDLWTWSGSSTKRPGLKGKAKKEYYKTVVRGRETISVGECAVFLSTGRPNLPYVGRIEHFWEGWGGQMVVKVKWFYHPEETKGGKRLQNMKGALFRSDHEDENDVQTISHKCEVMPYADFRRRKDVISLDDNDDVYYLAGSYEPTVGHIKFEPGVI